MDHCHMNIHYSWWTVDFEVEGSQLTSVPCVLAYLVYTSIHSVQQDKD